MSERPPPGVAEDAAVGRAEALTPEAIERTLADFRAWLEEAARRGAEEGGPAPADDRAPIDLHTLLGQMTALRHEVHLQTRAVRAQQDQNAEALEDLRAAFAALEEARAGAGQAAEQGEDELLRPLLKTLVDLYDALALAAREVQRVREAVLPVLEQLSADADVAGAAYEPEPPPADLLALPAWARWLGLEQSVRRGMDGLRERADGLREELAAERRRGQDERQRRAAAEGRVRDFVESLVTGYTMSLKRAERALAEHGLEPIESVGRPFDPERMEVTEVVAGSDRPSGEVVEEVRRGYLWRGRVFRYAQVRVARS